MRRVKVVIGANYGDEGKGLLTDYYASQREKTLVIRANGGAQAGHTVMVPGGPRHVFSHFGSGTFAGASTLLTEEFLCNPIVFLTELTKLRALGYNPYVLIDRRASITTPIDIWLNQAAEDARSPEDKHGSVGLGAWETVHRRGFLDLTCDNLSAWDDNLLREQLNYLEQTWLPRRAAELGLTDVVAQRKPKFDHNRFIAACRAFVKAVRITRGEIAMSRYDSIVFEGAQGLGLDQSVHEKYATASSTGLPYVMNVCREAGISAMDITYVTRAYLTRHGAGPLPGEVPKLEHAEVVDDTNRLHPYQGALRFAPLDITHMYARINSDLSNYMAYDYNKRIRLAVTCLDQVRGKHVWLENGVRHEGSVDEFLAALVVAPVEKLMVSDGPTREHVKDLGTIKTGIVPYSTLAAA
jgi:adenylosuccinate synthase